MKITLRLVYWVLIAAALYAAFAYFRLPVLRLFLIANIAMVLFSLIQAIWNFRMVSVQMRTARSLIPRGQNARWFVQVKNLSRVSSIPIRVYSETKDRNKQVRKKTYLYGNLAIQGEQTAVLTIPSRHCGVLYADKLRVAVGDLFSFFYLYLPSSRVNAGGGATYVLPLAETHAQLADESLVFLEGAHQSKRPFDESEELDQVRMMQAGDPLKKIHWKLSARVSDWMVKQYRPEDDIFWTMLCDVQTLSEPYSTEDDSCEYALALRDFALDAAAALLETALLQGRKLELNTYHPDLQKLKGSDISLYPEFLKQLANLPAEGSLSFTEQMQREMLEGNRNPYILVSTKFDEEIFQVLQAFLPSKTEVFFVLIPFEGKISPEQSHFIDQLRLNGMKIAVSNFTD